MSESNFKFERIKPTGKESITVLSTFKDRIIFRPVEILPKEESKILGPDSKPMSNHHYDRHPLRGVIKYVSEDLRETWPVLKPGATMFIEDIMACTPIRINGEDLAMTRISNIILVYVEKKKHTMEVERNN